MNLSMTNYIPQKVSDSVKALYRAQMDKKRFDKAYGEIQKKESLFLSNFIFSSFPKGESSFTTVIKPGTVNLDTFNEEEKRVRVTRVHRKTVKWDTKKLRKSLGKKLFSSVVQKTYEVTDMQGLVDYLKQCGVDPKKFKQFIGVTEKVDTQKIDKLYLSGIITKKDISGCYDVELGEPYIRLTELKE